MPSKMPHHSSPIPNTLPMFVSIPTASPNKYTVSIMPHLIKTLSIIPHLQIDAIHNASHFWSSIPNTSLMLGINPQYLTALFELSEIPPYPSSILSHHALWMIRNNWDAQRQQQATPKGNRDSHEATEPPITPQPSRGFCREFALHHVNRIRSVLCDDRSSHHSPH